MNSGVCWVELFARVIQSAGRSIECLPQGLHLTAEVLQALPFAVRREVLQRVDLGAESKLGGVERVDPGLRFSECRVGNVGLTACLGLGAFARTYLVHHLERVGGPTADLGAGVGAVDLGERVERLGGGREIGDVAAVLLEVFERLRGIVDGGVGELRQRVVEVSGQIGVDLVADPRTAHDVEQ